ncbi:MAG: hypothetical protein QM763_12275 [Agriterribacter sp.]
MDAKFSGESINNLNYDKGCIIQLFTTAATGMPAIAIQLTQREILF